MNEGESPMKKALRISCQALAYFSFFMLLGLILGLLFFSNIREFLGFEKFSLVLITLFVAMGYFTFFAAKLDE